MKTTLFPKETQLITQHILAGEEHCSSTTTHERHAQTNTSVFLSALAAATVAACGGGSGSMAATNPATAPYLPLLGQTEPIGQARPPSYLAAAQSLPTPDQLMDWAERTYPTLFPDHQANRSSDSIVYRFYPKSGNYVGVSGSDVLVLGPISDNAITKVGTLAQFAESVAAASPAVASDAEAARFLLQAQFSASDAEISVVRSQGFVGWLEQQFNAPASLTGWDALMSKGYNDIAFTFSTAPADYMAWNQLIASPDAVRKRVALALSELFVVSSNGINISARSFAMAAYWDILAANAFGNYRVLLEAITLNPAMGVYLNTRGNQKEDATSGRQPDENYGREVMQLFTIGLYELNVDGSNKLSTAGQPIETYDQSTVTNIARAFTGWDLDTTGATATNLLQVKNPMRLIASRHSTLACSFFGTSIPANTDGTTALKITLDVLFNHANTGPFLSKQLIQRLVTSNPSPAYVGRVAAIFNNNGSGLRGDLKAVIKAVLLDTEARSATNLTNATWGKLREPIVRFTQWARSFNAQSTNGDWKIPDLTNDSTRLGQSPMRSGSVFNFFRPGYVPPNTALAPAALVAPEFQITNESTVAGYINFMQSTIQNGIADVVPNYSNELALVNDPVALVNRLNLILAAGQLSAATLSIISSAIASISSTTVTGQKNRVYAAILLVMVCPQYIAQK